MKHFVLSNLKPQLQGVWTEQTFRVFSDFLFTRLLAVVSGHPLLFFFASSSLLTQESEVLSESIRFLGHGGGV